MKQIIKNSEGQAIIELIIFLPILMLLFSFLINVGNAVNASINQQKITRGYLFYRTQNDSTIPKKIPGANPHLAWNSFGSYFIGWKEREENTVPIASCYKIDLPTGTSDNDSCDQAYSGDSTSFIRVQTAYGICGTTYLNSGGMIFRAPQSTPAEVSQGVDPCIIK